MTEKQKLWTEISTKDPALKQLLEKVREKFGKPQVNYVRFLDAYERENSRT